MDLRYTEKEYKSDLSSPIQMYRSLLQHVLGAPMRLINEISLKIAYFNKLMIQKVLICSMIFIAVDISLNTVINILTNQFHLLAGTMPLLFKLLAMGVVIGLLIFVTKSKESYSMSIINKLKTTNSKDKKQSSKSANSVQSVKVKEPENNSKIVLNPVENKDIFKSLDNNTNSTEDLQDLQSKLSKVLEFTMEPSVSSESLASLDLDNSIFKSSLDSLQPVNLNNSLIDNCNYDTKENTLSFEFDGEYNSPISELDNYEESVSLIDNDEDLLLALSKELLGPDTESAVSNPAHSFRPAIQEQSSSSPRVSLANDIVDKLKSTYTTSDNVEVNDVAYYSSEIIAYNTRVVHTLRVSKPKLKPPYSPEKTDEIDRMYEASINNAEMVEKTSIELFDEASVSDDWELLCS